VINILLFITLSVIRPWASSELSSGLVCFDVQGMKPEAVMKTMHDKGSIMGNTPYRTSYARFASSLLNTE
jgi:hypothetical protein